MPKFRLIYRVDPAWASGTQARQRGKLAGEQDRDLRRWDCGIKMQWAGLGRAPQFCTM